MKSRPNPSKVPLFIPLESVSVASPCNADWDAMQGDDRSRFCSGCAKNVYNLSALTKSEAEALLLEKEGKLCVRYFQRPDGTMLTQDCPIGLLRANEAVLQPQFALWANAVALKMLVAALIIGALSPMVLLAQPYQTTGAPIESVVTPTSSPTSTPSATPTPKAPPESSILGRPAYKPSPTPTTAPLRAEMGDVSVSEIRGEITATPTPVLVPHTTMGKIAQPPVCAPTPQTPPAVPVLMGLVATRPTMGAPVMGEPTPSPSKKTTKVKKSTAKKNQS